MMQLHSCPVRSLQAVARNVFVLTLHAPGLASTVRPGQFVNIQINESLEPLLRRPFSVHRASGDSIEVLFNIVGKGTAMLAEKREGDLLGLLGPLGVPFALEDSRYDTALLVAGGLGVAPMPLTTADLLRRNRAVRTFVGARDAATLVTRHLHETMCATDDGSSGFHGNVVALLEAEIGRTKPARPKIFACGPHAMLRATALLAERLDIPCEVSMEGPMGCGIGICQGCPVELREASRRYALMCKDGPTFDAKAIRW
jgi:dihydroorotate dehydrogenase electron transfer subunit